MHLGIGFVTGRRHFKRILETYVNNWLEHGLTEYNIRLHLFIAYDLKYQNTEADDFRNIDPWLKEKVDSITYVDESKIRNELKGLEHECFSEQNDFKLIFGDGYAKKRNSVLYFAIKRKMNKLLFLDDDEYPLALSRTSGNHLFWGGQSVVGTHLQYNTEGTITHGHHCGYISPIPKISFNNILSEEDFRLFIETISNDIISWDKVRENIFANNGVTFADVDVIRSRQIDEVQEEHGMKFISGSNLCFSLSDYKNLPPFFNPPGARGEDTFMSTCLSQIKVVKVPCYTFHDGFGQYKKILSGVLPLTMQPVDISMKSTLDRFVLASLGWIRYKPLLLYITQRDNYGSILSEMKAHLNAVVPKMCEFFGTEKFNNLKYELKHYDKNVKRHYAQFEETKRVWNCLMKSFRH